MVYLLYLHALVRYRGTPGAHSQSPRLDATVAQRLRRLNVLQNAPSRNSNWRNRPMTIQMNALSTISLQKAEKRLSP